MRVPKREIPAAREEPTPKKPARRAAATTTTTKKSSSAKKEGKENLDLDSVGTDSGPFPSWTRPSPAECFAARDALALLHGEPGAIPIPSPSPPSSSSPANNKATFNDPNGCHNDCLSVLDSLVRTILSQNTTDATSIRAFRSLKTALPTWEQVRTADVGIVEEAIRVGGLAEIKAARILKILETIRAEALEKKKKKKKKSGGGGADEEKKEERKKKAGAAAGFNDDEDNNSLLCLEHLREWPDAERIKEELVRFNGVGPKTAGKFFVVVVAFLSLRKSFFLIFFLSFSFSLLASFSSLQQQRQRQQQQQHNPKTHAQYNSLRRPLRPQEARLPSRHPHPSNICLSRLDAEIGEPRAGLRAFEAPRASDGSPRLARASCRARESLREVCQRREGGRRRREMRDEGGGGRSRGGGEKGRGGVMFFFFASSSPSSSLRASLFPFLSSLPVKHFEIENLEIEIFITALDH